MIGALIPNGFPPDAIEPIPAEWLGKSTSLIKRAALPFRQRLRPALSRQFAVLQKVWSSTIERLYFGLKMSAHLVISVGFTLSVLTTSETVTE